MNIRQARSDIEDYGLAVRGVDAAEIELANDRIARLALVSQYASQRLAQALVPALGRLAKAMTDSLREGGTLRAVIDGLTGNLQRMGSYLAVAVAGFGTRYVAALVAAKLATATLSGALVFLRGALIRTGIGALIVGAGELVYQLSRLISRLGGFGEALRLMKAVAGEVWERMGLGASSMGASLSATWDHVSSGFYEMIATLQTRWSIFLRNLAGAMNGIPGFKWVVEDLHGASVKARAASYETTSAADEGVLYGNPPRSAHAPERDDFLAWMRATESLAGSGSLTSFNETLTMLQARPAVAEGKFALVISDAEEAGVYERAAGDWQKVAGLPAIFTESLAAVRAEAARDLAQTYAAAANASRQEAAEIVGFDPTLSLSKRTDVPGWNVGGLPFIFASGTNEDSYHHDDSTNSHIFRSDATTGDLDDLGSSRVKAAFADFREWRHAEGLKVGQLSGVYGISIGTDANGRENSGRLFLRALQAIGLL
ncbi:hypothetical protein [Tritonibacter mobilis]|uniref:hypothetical protein n=1 Tax=Tritonibacter mobilis TaxID=379347 RepID=UPI002091971C|nr:hypothetical protein [Tritonibacter mobilis]WHQ82297.1 hypothetical protein OMR53_13990 [Tritonibacter mobilis]